MPDSSPRHFVRPGLSFRERFFQRRWGEAAAFFLIFVLGLIFFLVQLSTWAIPQLTLYQEFVPSRGVVLETRIEERTTGDGPDAPILYRPEVLLEHYVQDTPYQVWAYDFRTLSPDEGFQEDRKNAVAALIPFALGSEVECWYRDSDPAQVVVHWKFAVFGWFLLLLSFSFIVLGVIGFLQSFRLVAVSEERKSAAAASPKESPLHTLFGVPPRAEWPTVPDIRLINESPGTHLAFRLPLGNRPIFPLVGYMLLTIAVNAIAWGVMFHSFLNPEENWTDWGIGIAFRSLFCGAGIVLLVGLIHRLLVAFSLGPTLLEISDHPLYPGRRYRILLQQTGVLRFFILSVDVVCEETARFRQGTDTVTSHKEVFRQNLFIRKDFETTPDLPLKQEFFIQLPIGAMHSLRLENNEVTWKLEIFAQIAGWPDICRECPIIVRPVVLNDLTLEGSGL